LGKIRIHYEKYTGEQEHKDLPSSIHDLWLSGWLNIASINLEPLPSFPDLRRINLSHNAIDELDLRPLASCSELESLYLHSNALESVDLEPIASCSQLKALRLHSNELKEIDLGALASCTQLTELNLRHNELKQIDLSPLESCKNLEYLNLRSNTLKQIQLYPLAHCSKLKELNLYGNELETIDLIGLASCPELYYLNLHSNKLREVDFTPLVKCHELGELYVTSENPGHVATTMLSKSAFREVNAQALEFVRHYDVFLPIRHYNAIQLYANLLDEFEDSQWKHLHLARWLPETIGLKGLGFLDVSFPELKSILNEENRSRMRKRLIDAFSQQIDDGGPTIGCDVDSIAASDNPELVSRLPQILEIRKQEMENTFVQAKSHEDTVNLRQLWLTSYAFDILTALDFGLECSILEFQQIVNAFQKVDVTIRTTDNELLSNVVRESHEQVKLVEHESNQQTIKRNMSDTMQNYIWALAEQGK
jgi:Leucine-rich repeat (LRR) protein